MNSPTPTYFAFLDEQLHIVHLQNFPFYHGGNKMKKTRGFLLAAGISLAMALTFSQQEASLC